MCQEHAEEIKNMKKRIAELEGQLGEAQAIIEKLRAELKRTQEDREKLKRAGKRQATPFRRRKRKEKIKKEGRRKGEGRFGYREKPSEEDIDETKRAELCGCPECGNGLKDVQEHEHFEIDIPEVKPKVTRYVSYSGECPTCHKRVWLSHPEQTSQATGAAGVTVGPRARALATDLKHRMGMSYEKVSETLNDAFGLNVTRSGWYQADHRLAQQARAVYDELIQTLQVSTIVHADETGWRIGALSAWLWVFTNQHITVYTIEQSRGHDVILSILGRNFKGVLVSDCFLAYDHHSLAEWLKQKCLSHLLSDLKDMNETKTRGAVRFARDVTALLKDALMLKIEKPALVQTTFAQRAAALEARLDALIDPKRRLSDPDNIRFAKRLSKHRQHILRFLYVDDLDATNNQAERMLRPAVITRKTNGCNRADTGAEAHAILSSILATCRQQSVPILDFFTHLQRYGNNASSLSPPPT
jgi:transposase